MDFSDDFDDEQKIINDYDEFMSELNLDNNLPQLPDLLTNSSYFNKQTIQTNFENSIKNMNSDEAKIVEIIKALKLKMSVPLYPQLYRLVTREDDKYTLLAYSSNYQGKFSNTKFYFKKDEEKVRSNGYS